MIVAVGEGGFLFGLGLFFGFVRDGLVAGGSVVVMVLALVLEHEVLDLCLDMASLLFF